MLLREVELRSLSEGDTYGLASFMDQFFRVYMSSTCILASSQQMGRIALRAEAAPHKQAERVRIRSHKFVCR